MPAADGVSFLDGFRGYQTAAKIKRQSRNYQGVMHIVKTHLSDM